MLFFKKRREERKRRAEEALQAKRNEENSRVFNDLLERAELGDKKAQDQLVHEGWKSTKPEIENRIAAIRQLVWIRKEYNLVGKWVVSNHTDWSDANGILGKVKALAWLVFKYEQIENEENLERLSAEIGFTRDQARQILHKAVQDGYKILLARRESLAGFEELRVFIDWTREDRSAPGLRYEDWPPAIWKIGIKHLPYPDDWNDLVARLYDTPPLKVFKGLPERGTGDVRLLAAQAIEESDLTQAQIALAYCNAWSDYRVVVGDILTAELARLVVRLRADVTSSKL